MNQNLPEVEHPYVVSIFSYDADKVLDREKVQQDHYRNYENDEGEEQHEHLFHCYKRIVFATSEAEAEQKYLRRIRMNYDLPSSYDLDIDDSEDELERYEDEDNDTGFYITVIR